MNAVFHFLLSQLPSLIVALLATFGALWWRSKHLTKLEARQEDRLDVQTIEDRINDAQSDARLAREEATEARKEAAERPRGPHPRSVKR